MASEPPSSTGAPTSRPDAAPTSSPDAAPTSRPDTAPTSSPDAAPTSPDAAPTSSPPPHQGQDESKALSPGSVFIIVAVFLLLVLLVLGCLYHHKFRRTSYGPLLDGHEHGSLGNFTNPMYDP
ncbi:prostate androgen-regulated mucin-like protein 1 [Poeciliopsis prolifica]|uniref:prostate androgen-regulated mucin-like protein 1 n=1 Tax=Poeciliopsis prolifica TaxID=188132 RepID=UPI0024142853|nr:prostate androgen-regulated mucin-like protein 1 [Poeciliopsis prolifica]